jgi:Glyoxalase-like domain
MRIELDHLFVCTSREAPEADKFVQFGLHEGPPNQHPGQGTACRHFSFANAMIELFWVSNPSEAQSESTKRTLLWERWSGREGRACPFGICLRPTGPKNEGPPPFPSWEYRPAYLPDPLVMHIGEAGIEEPMWIYMSFMTRSQREHWFTDHPSGAREITRLILTTPTPLRSNASQKIIENGVLTARTGATSLLEIELDGQQRKKHVDFRPSLPVIFQL